MKESFYYLKEKFGVHIVVNRDYNVRNNNSSIYAAREYIGNTYICSADNYFVKNPFELEVDDSYYAAVYADGYTKEWCMETGEDGYVNHVQIGGRNSWYMLGHVFWNEDFSRKFLDILMSEYELPETAGLLWESIYIKHIDELKLKIRRYESGFIFEFDSLDELRMFDPSYLNDTRSVILKHVAGKLCCGESEITDISAIKEMDGEAVVGFKFSYANSKYEYLYNDMKLKKSHELL